MGHPAPRVLLRYCSAAHANGYGRGFKKGSDPRSTPFDDDAIAELTSSKRPREQTTRVRQKERRPKETG